MMDNHKNINNNNNNIIESEHNNTNNNINNQNNNNFFLNNNSENIIKQKKKFKNEEKRKNINKPNDINNGLIKNNNSVLNIDQNNDNVITNKSQDQNDIKTLKIATQNIRGITNITKQIDWLNFCEEKDFDIVGLTETWAKEENCKYIFKNDTIKKILRKDKNTDEYKYFWANGEQTNGSGVGIMIKKTWAKHVYKIDKYEGNAISIKLSFKKRIKLQIIVVYYPTSTSQRKLRTHV